MYIIRTRGGLTKCHLMIWSNKARLFVFNLLSLTFSMLQKKKKSSVSLSRTTAHSSKMSSAFLKIPTSSSIKTLLLVLSALFIVYFLVVHMSPTPLLFSSPAAVLPTSRRHLVFAIASSSNSWPRRKPYIRLWYNRDSIRAFAFLDRLLPEFYSSDLSVPPILVSGDTSKFPYTFVGGLRSAIRVARVVKEIVDREESDVRWYVFGDDDTLFFVDNLAKTLGKYDHEKWHYIGSNSESYEQNRQYSFEMAFGGGGFAISGSLARVLARVLDSCLMRYPHLYGSDSRIFSCLTELGVSLTHEPGFHQVDMRGNLLGMLSAHPLSPIVSLHHLDAMEPIFPNMTTIQALEHLFEAVTVDSSMIFQQTVCYDRPNSLTISVSWGYAIQVFEGNILLPDLISYQRTFMPWRRSGSAIATHFMFNTRDYPKDPCRRPVIFYMENVSSVNNNAWSNYTLHVEGNCSIPYSMKNIQQIRVSTQKLEFERGQDSEKSMLLIGRNPRNEVISSPSQGYTRMRRHCFVGSSLRRRASISWSDSSGLFDS